MTTGSALLGPSERATEKHAQFRREALPHLDTLYGLARRFTGGDGSRAEDLVQEAMLKAYRNWDRFELGTNCRAWLMTILRNTFVSRYRKRRTRGRRVEYRDEFEGDGQGDVEPRSRADEVFDRTVDPEVTRRIDELPEVYRTVLVLSDLADLSYQEVAEVVGIPEGTVKSRLFRARRRLREQLEDYAREMGYV